MRQTLRYLHLFRIYAQRVRSNNWLGVCSVRANMANLGRLISVFEETRELLADPDNDFTWSSWVGREDALREMDGILSSLWCGVLPKSLSMTVLYAPTGPIQEVSVNSGWGKEFLSLADRFDEAMALTVPNSELQAQLEILRTEENDLETWLQDVRGKIEQLQKQLAQNAGDFQINETAKQILVLLSEESNWLPVSYFAPKLQMNPNRFTYYLEELIKLSYVSCIAVYEVDDEGFEIERLEYVIGLEGRAYLKENGLL